MSRYDARLRGNPVVYLPEFVPPAVRAAKRRRTKRRDLRFGLSERARVRISIEVRGRRCNKVPRKRRRRCKTVFTATRKGAPAFNRARLTAQASKRLASRRAFRMVIRMSDRQGRRATRIVKMRGFKVLRS